jgi:2-polyprenyl-3-methyl-5-hydroxy-6-metoxy-1,4-benzoquinol methylase
MRGETPFNKDIETTGHYLYTGPNAPLSARLANLNQSKAILSFIPTETKTILDVGCGDGTYTEELWEFGFEKVKGIDAAQEAIKIAQRKERKGLLFTTEKLNELAITGEKFDLAILRGVLHHVTNPASLAQDLFGLADIVIVSEPNGMNPILKLIEKLSPYHRKHGERSFIPNTIENWFLTAGYVKVHKTRFFTIIPFFFPQVLVRILSRIQTSVEAFPIVRCLFCGIQIQVYEKLK